MPATIYHASQVLECYTPLFGSAEMDTKTSSSEHLSHPQHILSSYSQMPIRQHNSDTEMYICCQCGDGPKVFSIQPTCVECSHFCCDSANYLCGT
ncbi:hypothetical protein BJY00DRAFT_317045 [Aspergillus carlsbadensis]|nr:hypothetical protein BJY00DRAFT_317045 [Aspergillus carlsbadensis]